MADEVLTLAGTSALSDEEVVQRVLAGDTALYEVVMRRYNTRLYRVARAILKNDGEAEDRRTHKFAKIGFSLCPSHSQTFFCLSIAH